jgi:hypothetical protein
MFYGANPAKMRAASRLRKNISNPPSGGQGGNAGVKQNHYLSVIGNEFKFLYHGIYITTG